MCTSIIFLKIFFFYVDWFKVFIEFVTVLFLWFGFFVREPCGNLHSLNRDRTHTSRIGRQSLNHWTNREVPLNYSLSLPLQNQLSLVNIIIAFIFSYIEISFVFAFNFFQHFLNFWRNLLFKLDKNMHWKNIFRTNAQMK